LQAGASYCREQLRGIAEVRELVKRELESMAEFCEVPPAAGAFYFLLRLRTDLNSMVLAEQLIREHRVAVIPGTAFGLEAGCHLRVAYGALQRATAAEGIGRLVEGLKRLKG